MHKDNTKTNNNFFKPKSTLDKTLFFLIIAMPFFAVWILFLIFNKGIYFTDKTEISNTNKTELSQTDKTELQIKQSSTSTLQSSLASAATSANANLPKTSRQNNGLSKLTTSNVQKSNIINISQDRFIIELPIANNTQKTYLLIDTKTGEIIKEFQIIPATK